MSRVVTLSASTSTLTVNRTVVSLATGDSTVENGDSSGGFRARQCARQRAFDFESRTEYLVGEDLHRGMTASQVGHRRAQGDSGIRFQPGGNCGRTRGRSIFPREEMESPVDNRAFVSEQQQQIIPPNTAHSGSWTGPERRIGIDVTAVLGGFTETLLHVGNDSFRIDTESDVTDSPRPQFQVLTDDGRRRRRGRCRRRATARGRRRCRCRCRRCR